ncbi:MAG TPA: DUF2157 domain-containing protein [Gaiellaceae bacterium]|jgi:uncharacterized membrane protein
MATFVERIAAETRAWVRDGLISEDQAEAIRARYAEGAASERRGRLITVLATIGAVAIGIGVILFFAANWDGIPKAGRLVVLLLGLVATLAGGDALRARSPRVGEAVTFLGGLLFGAAIFLVGQMYNLDDHAGAGFLLWAGGAAAGTAVFRTPRWAALAVATLGTWLAYVVADVDYGELVPFVLGLYGLAVYALGTRLRETELLGLPRAVGFALATIPVFVLTFGHVADEAADHEHLRRRVVAACVGTAIAAVAAAIALALDPTRPTRLYEGGAIAVAACALLLATRVPLTPVAFNLLLIALALGAIWVGYENDEVWLVNLGVAAVAAELIGRFFDTFWHLLPRSAAFLAAGILVLGIAWALERQRSRLVARMSR